MPDALVKDLLAVAGPVSEAVGSQFQQLGNERDNYRRAALDAKLILRKADLDVPREPSVAGIDGSYQLHHLTALDLCAAAAVAVEGTSKEATRYWPEPYHRILVETATHASENQLVLRGLMVIMELELAQLAPHDVVLLDGAFGSLIIYLNQGLSNIGTTSDLLGKELQRRWVEERLMSRLLRLLRGDKAVAIPKYTSKNELVDHLGLDGANIPDGRTLATLVLEPDEYTKPLPVYMDDFHLPSKFCSAQDDADLNSALQAVRVVYYKPYGWIPAVRIEIPGSIANSATRLSTVLEGVNRQIFTPAVIEPYPLFLADRMVKSLGAGVNVVEQTVSQYVIEQATNIETAMLLLQNYRTEGGRGGV